MKKKTRLKKGTTAKKATTAKTTKKTREDTPNATPEALVGAGADETARTTASKETAETAAEPEPPQGGASKTPRAPAASTPAVRKSMQGNKCKDTKPELLVRQYLREAGLTGYRLQWKVPERPDIAWPGKKVCIQVMGCFWHRHEGCKYATSPKSHTEYWVVKFDRNVERDRQNEEALREAGWKVHLIWECQLKKGAIDQTMGELLPILAEELGKDLKGNRPA